MILHTTAVYTDGSSYLAALEERHADGLCFLTADTSLARMPGHKPTWSCKAKTNAEYRLRRVPCHELADYSRAPITPSIPHGARQPAPKHEPLTSPERPARLDVGLRQPGAEGLPARRPRPRAQRLAALAPEKPVAQRARQRREAPLRALQRAPRARDACRWVGCEKPWASTTLSQWNWQSAGTCG